MEPFSLDSVVGVTNDVDDDLAKVANRRSNADSDRPSPADKISSSSGANVSTSGVFSPGPE